MLTDLQIKALKPTLKRQRVFDGGGLYIEISPAGGKLWRLKYRFDGKEKRLALGDYPSVTIKEARKRRDEARSLLSGGMDPGAIKRAQKAGRLDAAANSFEVTARRWCETNKNTWTEKYATKTLSMLQRDVFPWLGTRPVSELEPPDFLATVRRIEARGYHETAHRALQRCGQVMRFAVAEGLALRDPTADLRGALSSWEVKHMPSVIDPARVGQILRMFEHDFKGTFQVQCALRLAPLFFTRPQELRRARWADIDLCEAIWRIPAEEMKMREPHLVPLAKQAVAILEELHPVSGHLEYVFPGGRDPKKHMSDAAVNMALKRLGIDTKTELTGHGFRAMARTILHERLGYQPEIIEAQLAHKTPGPLGAAYARAKFIDQRKEMMQDWADYLDKLKKEHASLKSNSPAGSWANPACVCLRRTGQ
jgi:integrase